MASQDLVQQLVGSVLSNPDLMNNLAEHPYSAVAEATGTSKEDLTRDDVSQALAAFSALAGGQQVDFANLASMAEGLLGQYGGSAHSLAQGLFGAPLAESQSTATAADPISDMLANLANVDFAKGIAGVDLSDGLGLDDVIGFASAMLGGAK